LFYLQFFRVADFALVSPTSHLSRVIIRTAGVGHQIPAADIA